MKKNDLYSIRMRASSGGRHISGAEGLFRKGMVGTIAADYCERALTHPKGVPDEIIVTIDLLARTPVPIRALRVATAQTASPREARAAVKEILASAGVSLKAIKKAFGIVSAKHRMRGAAVLAGGSGQRLEPDKKRGVRATALGITEAAAKRLSTALRAAGIDTATVREAVVLASKIASFPATIAELCVSDDPGYTTGYVTSPHNGYLRIPRIKPGKESGGRVIFVRDDVNMVRLIEYLERTPVLVSRISAVRGEVTIDEIIRRSAR